MPLLRISCPPARTDRIVDVLRTDGGAEEVSVLPAVGRPDGEDLILAELPRARVDPLLARVGTVPGDIRVWVEPSLRVLPAASAAEVDDDEAVVWAQVAHDIHAAGRWSWVNLLLTVAAAAIAAVGILQGQLLLIVGAMALSPDYYPIADTSLALSRRAWGHARRAAATLALSFAAAIVGAWLLAEALHVTGLVSPSGDERPGELTLFIAHPDGLSVLVALIAGAAGALAITLPGARGLVGVFVSITTIPAAANIGVAAAARDPGELAGAAVQLLVNVTSLLVAGTITLALRHRGRAPRQLPDPLPRPPGRPWR